MRKYLLIAACWTLVFSAPRQGSLKSNKNIQRLCPEIKSSTGTIKLKNYGKSENELISSNENTIENSKCGNTALKDKTSKNTSQRFYKKTSGDRKTVQELDLEKKKDLFHSQYENFRSSSNITDNDMANVTKFKISQLLTTNSSVQDWSNNFHKLNKALKEIFLNLEMIFKIFNYIANIVSKCDYLSGEKNEVFKRVKREGNSNETKITYHSNLNEKFSLEKELLQSNTTDENRNHTTGNGKNKKSYKETRSQKSVCFHTTGNPSHPLEKGINATQTPKNENNSTYVLTKKEIHADMSNSSKVQGISSELSSRKLEIWNSKKEYVKFEPGQDDMNATVKFMGTRDDEGLDSSKDDSLLPKNRKKEIWSSEEELLNPNNKHGNKKERFKIIKRNVDITENHKNMNTSNNSKSKKSSELHGKEIATNGEERLLGIKDLGLLPKDRKIERWVSEKEILELKSGGARLDKKDDDSPSDKSKHWISERENPRYNIKEVITGSKDDSLLPKNRKIEIWSSEEELLNPSNAHGNKKESFKIIKRNVDITENHKNMNTSNNSKSKKSSELHGKEIGTNGHLTLLHHLQGRHIPTANVKKINNN